MEKKTILISGVSKADEKAESAPVDVSVEKLKPDILLLIHTEFSDSDKDKELAQDSDCKIIEQSSPDSDKDKDLEQIFCAVKKRQSEKKGVVVRSEKIRNSIEYGPLLQDIKDIMETIYEEYPADKHHYFINITSGFAQLKVIFIILKEIGFLKGEIIEKPDIRYQDSQEEDIKPLNLDFISEINAIDNVKRYLAKYDFINCKEEMQRYSDSTGNKKKDIAEAFINIFEAYEAWDNINYVAAKKHLKAFWEKYNGSKKIKNFFKNACGLLDEQYQLLKQLDIAYQNANRKKDIILEGRLNLFIDYYYFAYRNYAFGEYINILGIYDNMRQRIRDYLLCKIYGLTTEEGLEKIKSIPVKNDNGLYDTTRIKLLESIEEEMNYKKIREKRDMLLINHGSYSIDKDNASKILVLYRKVLEETCKSEKAAEKISDYAFSLENIDRINDDLDFLKSYREGE